jgi:hypothetical protein
VVKMISACSTRQLVLYRKSGSSWRELPVVLWKREVACFPNNYCDLIWFEGDDPHGTRLGVQEE